MSNDFLTAKDRLERVGDTSFIVGDDIGCFNGDIFFIFQSKAIGMFCFFFFF